MNYSPEVIENMSKWIDKQNSILEEEMIHAKATEMQQDMDREILWSMLTEMGWTRVMLEFRDNNHAVDIAYWVDDHCQGNVERNGRDFLFENQQDAVNFILKWK